MSELKIGSLWRGKWDFNEGMRMIIAVCEAHNPPSGVLLVTYHDVDDGETRSVMCMLGEWEYEFELVSD